MRILFVSRCLPLPRHHGDRLILFHLLRGLRARGHRCSVVALAQPSDDSSVVAESAALADRLEAFPERPRSPLPYARRLRAPFPSSAERAWQPDVWRAVERITHEDGCEVVHVLGGIQVYEHRDAAGTLPRVIHPYESYSWWLTRAIAAAGSPLGKFRLRLARAAARVFERRIYRGFDRVLLSTDLDARSLEALAPGLPTAVLPLAVDAPDRVVPLRERAGAPVVFVGTFSYAPNAAAARRLVDDVLPLLRARVPDVRVALVGAEPPESVRRLAGPGVEVTGTVPDVFPWLSAARVFVSALRHGAGMKSKILEAMAAGTPVVATRMSCDGLDVVDGRHVLFAESSVDLSNAAARVLSDEDLAARLAEAGRRLVVERYRWPAVVARLEGLYADVIAERGRSVRT